jgi:hypothetical protein
MLALKRVENRGRKLYHKLNSKEVAPTRSAGLITAILFANTFLPAGERFSLAIFSTFNSEDMNNVELPTPTRA